MACDPNTLLASGAAFQTLSERDQMICIAELLCEISQGGGTGGSVRFGDPSVPGGLISGGLIYDSLGNVWVDQDPAGAHSWQKIISAQAPEPVMALAARVSEPMVVTTSMEAPKAEELPPVELPKPRNRWREALRSLQMFLLMFVP